MLRFVLLALCLYGIDVARCQSHFDNKCDLMTVSDPNSADQQQQIDLQIPSDCTSGNVDWHYPKGYLHLMIGPNNGGSYSLCIEESWSTMISSITDMTGGGNTNMPLPSQGNPKSCTSAVHGRTELKIGAYREQLYMTTFKYSIQFASTN